MAYKYLFPTCDGTSNEPLLPTLGLRHRCERALSFHSKCLRESNTEHRKGANVIGILKSL